MTVETLYATDHLAGNFVNPTNAIGNTPGTWAGELNTSSSRTSRWALGNPVNTLTPGYALHTITLVAKKGSNSGTPTITMNLYNNGVLVKTLVSGLSVTSTTGQTLSSGFITTAELSDKNNIEIEIVMNAAGGSGSARNSAQISMFTLSVDTTVIVLQGRVKTSTGALKPVKLSTGVAKPVKVMTASGLKVLQ